MQNKTISGFRLSPQQKRLWLLQQDGFSTLASCAILLKGNLQPEILKAALQKVVERHEILRTNFRRLPGMKTPVMVVEDPSDTLWRDINLTDCKPEEQSVKIEEILQWERTQTFALEKGRLLRLTLITLSPEKQILAINLPALCADSWTLNNLVREIGNSYASCLQGEELDDEIVQYVQFSEWQNQLLEDEDAETGKNYWQQQDFSNLSAVKLPCEKKIIEKAELQPDCLTCDLNSDVVEKMEALLQKYDSSTDLFFLACWQIQLWRLTGQADITIGMGCDRREYEELHRVLGLLATWLPIRCRLTPNLCFIELLKLLEKAKSDAEEWQDYFVWEDEANGGVKIFPFGFEYEECPEKCLAAGVSFSLYKQYTCIEPFKVKLACLRHNDGLKLSFHYDINYFSSEAIKRLAGQFQTLLSSVINNPEAAIDELEILSASDRQQLLIEFNQNQSQIHSSLFKGETKSEIGQCIHQLFEAQVERTPNNIAVVFENQQLTYRELNVRANQLARYLQKLGVGLEVLVGLYLERSLETIVGILGILKAGGAYLPLDPALPAAGLALRLQDAQASFVISHTSLAGTFEQTTAIYLDRDWDAIAQESEENPITDVTLQNLVYVLFTSGSTGRPKGVAIEHRQLHNYIDAIADKLNLPTNASFATVSTFAADLGNTVIFPALSTGGCLHILSSERASDPEALADYFSRHPIDCLKIVPSHLNALLAAANPQKILPRTHLILGGEALNWQLVEKLQQYQPSCQIFNHYGPTEATVGVTTFAIPKQAICLRHAGAIASQSETVPIGRPLPNTQVYILDRRLRPLPIGVPGELHIGGNGVGRGYLNQPELTAQKFIPNPFEQSKLNSQSRRLYKTGDLARYLPDGNIEFLGRIDNQVKIRGFRIELGEIESVLTQHPAIRETFVLAREDEAGNKRLVAYVVWHRQSEFAAGDLRSFLKEKLPEYMMPSAFVPLKALPLTPNGKVDRAALPAPDSVRSELEATFVAPSNPIEETIARIWAEVLEIERVGIYDNFFELGGDSIMSIRIVARINQTGLQVTPKQLFESQTVAGLAAVARHTPTIQTEPESVTGSLSLTPIQHRFFEQHQPDWPRCYQSLLLEVRQAIGWAIAPAVVEQAVQQLRSHHDALRLRFVPTESSWQQVFAPPDEMPPVPFSYIDLSELPLTEQESSLEQFAANLNLTPDRLMQVALFNFGDNQPLHLLLAMHQLATDSVSWRILLEDLSTAIAQLSQGQTVSLPNQTASYQQWSEFLPAYPRSAQIQAERDYWLAISRESVSKLPVDHRDSTNLEAATDTVSVSLSLAETRALLEEVPAAYRTETEEVLLAALVQSFRQWTKQQSLLVDLETDGRKLNAKNLDLSRTVGCFTTIFPVLLSLEGISQPGEALKAIKEQLRGVPNRGIGYGVQRYLSQDAEVAIWRQALAQAEVKFSYNEQFDPILSASSLFERITEKNVSPSRPYLLEIDGFVLGERLQLKWTYSQQMHQRTTIEKLAFEFIEALRSLIAHCQSPAAFGYTASDFPKANLTQKQLEQFLAKINRGSEKTNS